MTDSTQYVVTTGNGTQTALIGEAQTPVGKVAAWVPVSQDLLDDSLLVRSYLDRAMRRLTHPWEFPDRNPFPAIDPVPWFTRRLSAYRDLRCRIADARYVLRYGMPDRDEGD